MNKEISPLVAIVVGLRSPQPRVVAALREESTALHSAVTQRRVRDNAKANAGGGGKE